MSESQATLKTMSAREAIAAVGFEALARADFGAGVAYYRARPAGAAGAEGGDAEVLVQLVLTGGGAAATAERGIRTVSRLDHPNMLRLIGIRAAPGVRALIFQSFRGRSLAREVERAGRIEPRRALLVGAAVSRALAHAHGRDAIHGAVSEGNIALGLHGEVKLVGFGGSIGPLPAPSGDDDLAALGAALRRAMGPERAEPAAARVLERAMRLRPEIGFYPDATALAVAFDAAARHADEARADMSGRFDDAAALASLFQMLELSRRSGRLDLTPAAGGTSGALAFREGKIVGARAGAASGRDAILRLLSVPAGRFRMWFGPVPPSADPAAAGAEVPISAALVEAARRRDESAFSSRQAS